VYSVSYSDGSFYFDCDPGREFVTAEVKSARRSNVERILIDFEGALGLDIADLSYREQKIFKAYTIELDEKKDSKKSFNVVMLETITSALEGAFTKKLCKEPVVADCSLTDEDGKRQVYRKLDRLYDALRQDQRFVELYFCVDGPQFNWLALHLNRTTQRLEFQANLNEYSFYDVEKVFKKSLVLRDRPVESDSKKESSGQSDPKKATERPLLQAFVGALPVGIAAGITGAVALITFVLPEWTPRYTLEILRPVSSGNGSPTPSSATLDLYWATTEKRFWRESFRPDVLAEVLIVCREDGHSEDLKEQRAPLTRALTPGTYEITVISSKPAKPAIVTVSVGKVP